jgi:hypothetical protein
MEQRFQEILLYQLAVGRMGESCRKNWWNVDSTDRLGGFSILEQFFMGNQKSHHSFSRLISGEAILQAAKLQEKTLLEQNSQKKNLYGLFFLPFGWNHKIEEVWAHYKSYPLETPNEVLNILNPDMGTTQLSELIESIFRGVTCDYETTPVGLKIQYKSLGIVDTVKNMASLTIQHSGSTYPLVYFEYDGE